MCALGAAYLLLLAAPFPAVALSCASPATLVKCPNGTEVCKSPQQSIDEACSYLLVKDLPFVGNTTDLTSYLKGIYNLGIGLAVTFAILVLVGSGIKYMLSDIITKKAEAINDMKNAVIGLMIIFGSVLVLNTINPRLTEFRIIDTIQKTKEAIKRGQNAPPPSPDGNSGGTATGDPWPSDANERTRLETAGIRVNKKNCTHIGQEDCTSVAGLSDSAIEGLINLKQQCDHKVRGCNIIVTGGTEHWLHSTHDDGRTIDLSDDASLTLYLGGHTPCTFTEKGGDFYRWEDSSCSWRVTGPHWHVTF